MNGRSERQFGALYQLAGDLLVGATVVPDADSRIKNTPGQQGRMVVLLLDALSEPGRWSGKEIADAHRRAKEE